MKRSFHTAGIVAIATAWTTASVFAASGGISRQFIESHCSECHDADTDEVACLDLTALKSDLSDAANFSAWVLVHDRVESGEMPPKKKTPPPHDERDAFLSALTASLTEADRARYAQEGRATRRRMNRFEYEDTLRDLLSLPNLEVKDFLPEDGESHRFNKSGDALDVSHVNLARYLNAADFALRQALAPQIAKPELKTIKYFAREQKGLAGRYGIQGPLCRRTFPVPPLEKKGAEKAADDPKAHELDAVGIVVSTYEPTEIQFNGFRAPVSGNYKLRFSGYSIWVGGGDPAKPWIPDFSKISKGRRNEPITIYSDIAPRLLRKLGSFDVEPEPTINERTVWLMAGETIRPDAARFFRSRPPEHKNPLAEKDGMPGVAFQWMEVEGPLVDQWPPAGHTFLFGDLPMEKHDEKAKRVEVVSANPEQDAAKLLHSFMARAYRGPIETADEARFLEVVRKALKSGHTFTDSMLMPATPPCSRRRSSSIWRSGPGQSWTIARWRRGCPFSFGIRIRTRNSNASPRKRNCMSRKFCGSRRRGC